MTDLQIGRETTVEMTDFVDWRDLADENLFELLQA
jgi:hypothetical protein